MRPIPANRFQLIPHPGSEAAIIRSALRYADNAIAGMPSAPGEFTAMAGGGAETVAAAIWKLVGGRLTATTAGPVGPLPAAATAATGAMVTPRKTVVRMWNWGAAAPTAPANNTGAIAATLNAGVRAARIARLHATARPSRCSGETTKAVSDLRTGAGCLAWDIRW